MSTNLENAIAGVASDDVSALFDFFSKNVPAPIALYKKGRDGDGPKQIELVNAIPESRRRALERLAVISQGLIESHASDSIDQVKQTMLADMCRCGKVILLNEKNGEAFLENPALFLKTHAISVSAHTLFWLSQVDTDEALFIIAMATLFDEGAPFVFDYAGMERFSMAVCAIVAVGPIAKVVVVAIGGVAVVAIGLMLNGCKIIEDNSPAASSKI